MAFQLLNPKEHPDWDEQLHRSGDHSFFHTSGWARVLEATYGFKPLYLTRQEGKRFSLLVPLMEVSGLLRGRRGVSLPFTDRCAPFSREPEEVTDAACAAIDYAKENGWRSIEWRDDRFGPTNAPAWKIYLTHEVGLGKSEADLFGGLSSNNRRNIRKALREGVTVRIDRSTESLRSFYRLNCITRKRHGLPPQPFIFFKNVHKYILSQDLGKVFSAFYAGKVIAAAVFFHFGTEALFKYGASEVDHRRLRPNNLVMWEALKWYNQQNFAKLSLGRTEPEDRGLLHYKRDWGARESSLRYFRFDIGKGTYLSGRAGSRAPLRRLFARIPMGVLWIIGRLFYRYFG